MTFIPTSHSSALRVQRITAVITTAKTDTVKITAVTVNTPQQYRPMIIQKNQSFKRMLKINESNG